MMGPATTESCVSSPKTVVSANDDNEGREGTDNNMDTTPAIQSDQQQQQHFMELMNYEDESKNYLEKLEKEEAELRAVLDKAIARNRGLRALQSTLEAKISAQKEKTGDLRVDTVRSRNEQLKARVEKVKKEKQEVSITSLTVSTSELCAQVGETGELENRLRRFRSPHTVANELKTKQVQASQVEQKLLKTMSEIGKIDKRVQGIAEQRKIAEIIEQLKMNVKFVASAAQNKKKKLQETVKLLEAEEKQKRIDAFPRNYRPRLPPLSPAPFSRSSIKK